MQWVVEAVEVHRRPLLRGVSFGAPAGAVTAVVGGDPRRHTVLFRLAAGLDRVERGAMLVLGTDMTRARRRAKRRVQRRLGVVFGGPEQALFADGTAWENVALAVRTAGRVGRGGVDAAVEAALDAVALGHVGGELPGSLSRPQRRRLALARALVLSPPLLLVDGLDEDGDPGEAVLLGEHVRTHCRRHGASALVFVREAAVAECVADVLVDFDDDPDGLATVDLWGVAPQAGSQSSTARIRR